MTREAPATFVLAAMVMLRCRTSTKNQTAQQNIISGHCPQNSKQVLLSPAQSTKFP